MNQQWQLLKEKIWRSSGRRPVVPPSGQQGRGEHPIQSIENRY